MTNVVGTDQRGGIPVPRRPDVEPPAHWRLEAIAATERPRDVVIAADGRSAVFILDRDTSDVWTLDLTAPVLRRLTTGRALMPYWEDTAPALSPDGTRVVHADDGALWIVPIAGGPPRKICADAGSPLWVDDERLVVTVDRDRSTRLALVRVDDAWPSPLASGPGDCWGASVAPDRSRVAFVFSPHDDRNRSEIRVVDLDGTLTVLTGTERMQDRAPAWAPDSQRIAFVSERPGWNEVFVVDAGGGNEWQLTHESADFADLAWSSDGATIAAIRTCRSISELVTIDAATGAVASRARGGRWGAPKWLPDRSLLAPYEDVAVAPQLCSVAPDGTAHAVFAPTPAAIAAAPHAPLERVTFTSFDGLEIEGLLYRPSGASASTKVAAIVNPHGGPTDHDGDDWYGHAQYFVDRGFAWLMVNFRGSTSYGRDFERANHGVWGVDDTKDCLAAYDFLATLDWIDRDRVAIFGGSYGSYMALCSVIDDDQHRYRCAATKYGDCDILTSWAQGDRDGVQDLERMMGHPTTARDAYRAGSPIHRIDNLAVPILVAHGERDERVHPAQSRELVEALERLGKTYEYVTYPAEGHGFLHAPSQIDFFRRLERFLDWYLM